MRTRLPAGVMFTCGKCSGRAVAFAVLRKQADPSFMKQLRMAATWGIGETRDIRVLGDATLSQLEIRDLVRATQWDEWGVAATIPSGPGGTSETRYSRLVNALAGVSLPAGALCALRHLHDRQKTAENDLQKGGDDHV